MHLLLATEGQDSSQWVEMIREYQEADAYVRRVFNRQRCTSGYIVGVSSYLPLIFYDCFLPIYSNKH